LNQRRRRKSKGDTDESHVGFLGKTGSSKSFATQGIVERLIEKHRRVCIIDPMDRYWGLRLGVDGKSLSGYEPVIFGGQHADLPLSATHGDQEQPRPL